MNPSIATPDPKQGSIQGFATVYTFSNNEKCLLSDVHISAGTEISSFGALVILESPNYLTLQIGVNKHILLQPEVLQYINHSCEPNVFFDTTTMHLVALKDIQRGEELRFFYPSTEWDMERPFVCNCQTSSCLGIIRGSRYIQPELLANYRLSNFIKQQMITSGLVHE